jgi:hypothetical protein
VTRPRRKEMTVTQPRRKEMTVGEEFVVVDERGNVDVDEFGNVESVDVMSREEALAITDRIREYRVAEWELRAQAFLGCVWIPLGYETFDAYLVGEFGPNKLRLPRIERRAAVKEMRSIEMSIRAIALAVGCDKNTVLSDLAKMKASQAQASEFQTRGLAITDESRDWLPFIRGLDKKIYPPPSPRTAAEKNADKRYGELQEIYGDMITAYLAQLAVQAQIEAWKTKWGRTGSDVEWDQLLCIRDQLAYMRDLAKDMQKPLDEITSPTLLDGVA